jgi:tight adherence protein B
VLSAVLLSVALVLLGPVRRSEPRAARPPWSPTPSSIVDGRAAPALAGGIAAVLAAALSTPLVAVLAGGCALTAARAERRRRCRVGEERRMKGLVEALATLAADLRSGRSVEAAAASAVRACPDEPSGEALVRALRIPDVPVERPSTGPVGEAVDRLAAAVRISGRTGCSLAALVAAVEDDLRARLRQRQDLRSAVAGPRASAVLLAALPLLGLAMGSGVGADPWHVLTTTVAGQVLLIAGVTLEVAGLAWSARLVRRAVA